MVVFYSALHRDRLVHFMSFGCSLLLNQYFGCYFHFSFFLLRESGILKFGHTRSQEHNWKQPCIRSGNIIVVFWKAQHMNSIDRQVQQQGGSISPGTGTDNWTQPKENTVQGATKINWYTISPIQDLIKLWSKKDLIKLIGTNIYWIWFGWQGIMVTFPINNWYWIEVSPRPTYQFNKNRKINKNKRQRNVSNVHATTFCTNVVLIARRCLATRCGTN